MTNKGEPYGTLLTNVPAELQPTLVALGDELAARQWLVDGTTPDRDSTTGVHPDRRHLEKIGTRDNGERWAELDGTKYTNDELTSLRQHTEPSTDLQPQWTEEEKLGAREPEPWHLQTIVPLKSEGAADAGAGQGEAMYAAGTYYAIVEFGQFDNRMTYRGVYKLTETSRNGVPTSLLDNRCWLNANAERLLAWRLTG